ncbi:ABC-type multidrug transport system, permease component [Xylanibacter oryzae DSM 17970]|uniref:Transport permease protein n=1 Tax=Xylanibacter oryzae DSM 17970 TaxID=915438 RepID=A0ABP3BCF0_9BACT|nr:ABC transporter permease [Xylanibacter oryzae]EXG77833.1 ABC-type multidrug transport system, permease component [Xylanibacter oryzae DSM 17970]
MKTFISFILKESRHILRDSRTMMILFGMPVVMMFLFGFAISTDVKNVRLVAVSSSTDDLTHKIVDRLDASEYFNVTDVVSSSKEAELLMRNQKADMAIVFSPNFANHRYDGSAAVQLIADATDPNTSIQQVTYAAQIIISSMGVNISPSNINTKLLYNPQMKSAYNFVPGIMGMLLLIICAMMTSVSIVREKERGTMEVLLVSPVRPLMIIVAKAIPYLVLSIIILTSILLISRFVLAVPVAGSLIAIFAVSLLYILLALSLGLLISVASQTQLAAMLISGMILLMPSIMLSGMIYPVESMPQALQYVADIVPARWYISAMRKLMIMGVSIDKVGKEVAVMTIMTVLLLVVSLKKFKKRLE